MFTVDPKVVMERLHPTASANLWARWTERLAQTEAAARSLTTKLNSMYYMPYQVACATIAQLPAKKIVGLEIAPGAGKSWVIVQLAAALIESK